MNHMTIPEALDKLAAEGDADQIAAFLREQGIRGEWESPTVTLTCPVARYLTAVSGELVQVAKTGWKLADDLTRRGGMPPEVGNFVRNFDLKAYPDLIEWGSDDA